VDDLDPTTPPRRLTRRRFLQASAAAGISLPLGVYADPFYEAPDLEGLDVPPKPPGCMRVLSLNAAHGRGTGFHQSLTRASRIEHNLQAIAQLIESLDVDLVALQELDAPSFWSGGFCHLEYLAREAGFGHSFHGLHVDRNVPRLAYGTGILSKHTISAGSAAPFARNALDTKGYALAHVDGPDLALDVVSVHLDFKRARERRAQLRDLERAIEERPDPSRHLVVAGDFNCCVSERGEPLLPWTERLELGVGSDDDATFPSRRPRRRLDHVFASAGLEVHYQAVLDVEVSDHRPVLADLRPVR
jgi:endonuclease/exonuclease/phosphatase family metal-dependent hydrolase